jgi:hypothetical protein
MIIHDPPPESVKLVLVKPGEPRTDVDEISLGDEFQGCMRFGRRLIGRLFLAGGRNPRPKVPWNP